MKNKRDLDRDQRGRERPADRTVFFLYLGITAFCLVFSQTYGVFSHGIRSFWMTYLAAWPLLLGALPEVPGMLRRGGRTGRRPQGAQAGTETGDSTNRPGRKAPGGYSGGRSCGYAGGRSDGYFGGSFPGYPFEHARGQGMNADRQSRLSLMTDLYPFGIAALTLASMLKGVLEIAGTDSLYPDLLLGAGALMTAAGAAVRVFYRTRGGSSF